MDLQALRLSLLLATLTALSLLVIGLPVSHWLASARFKGKAVVEAVLSLPLVLPPTVLGFYLLVAMGTKSPLGRAWVALTGHPLAFSFAGLLIASIVYGLPFAVQPFTAALSQVDPRLTEAASTLGASPFRAFFRISLPLAAPGIVAGTVLSFAHALGEFGVVLMVGGNIAGETRTLSIAIFDSVEELDYAAANTTALFLLGVSFAVLVAVSLLRRKA
ncbi:MAG TPA: molybdate ABC transporter permease subunit [Myxococcales bacterium]|jgi:molybdate transport system permease protein